MVKKSDDKLGHDGVHELATRLDKSVLSGGLLSGEDNVTVTLPRHLFDRLRNAINLIHYGMSADEALGVALRKGQHSRSHLEELRKRALAIRFSKEAFEREDKRTVIAEEIGQSPLATIGRDGVGVTGRTIQTYYSKRMIPWNKIDPDMQQTLCQVIDGTVDKLREFYEK